MVKCKNCPRAEISLRRDAGINIKPKRRVPQGFKLYCRFFDKHVDGHKERECLEGEATIEREGPRKLYPFT